MRMRTRRLAGALCTAGAIFAGVCAGATTISIDRELTLDASQLRDNGAANDQWMSGMFRAGRPGELVQLSRNDSITLNLKLLGGSVTMNDPGSNTSESIKIFVTGGAGPAGAPDNDVDYSFLFTDVDGKLLVNPVKGTVSASPLTGNISAELNHDLLAAGTAAKFKDVHLTLTSKMRNDWFVASIGLGVDAEKVGINPIPLPSGMLLLASSLLAAAGFLRRRA